MRDNIHSDSPYDCILMDAQMPILDGSQATAEIRSLGYQGPIIGLTAHQAPQEKNRLLQAGCQTVLEKPINREQFCTTIVKLVKEYQSSQPEVALTKK
jgi:CheY-like chemotaxis protein